MDLTIRLSADEAQTAVESGSMLDLIKVIKHEKVSDNARQITINEIINNQTTAKKEPADEKTEETAETAAEKSEEPSPEPAKKAAKPKHSKEEIRALAGPIVRAGLGKTKLRPVLGRFGVNSVSEAGDD
ncbi:MAG: hypothetical protein ACOYJI_07135, partial [Anaerovoracaceae bacterium]